MTNFRIFCNEDEKAEVQIPSKFIQRLFFTLENNVEEKKPEK